MEVNAIVAAAFGAVRLEGLRGIAGVLDRLEAAFPDIPVLPAFSSRFIRRKWRERSADPEWQAAHPDVPAWAYTAKSPLAVMADLQDQGCRRVLVQSLHMYAGEEYGTLRSTVEALAGIRTVKPRHRLFERLIIGRPALGEPGEAHPYREDLAEAARALEADAEEARRANSALVYMGHGNDCFASGAYVEFGHVLARTYPDLPVFVGVVEGFPGLDRVVRGLTDRGCRKVLLFPLLLTAGGHAAEDLAGDGDGSWKTVLESQGIACDCRVRGLGECPAFAEIFVRHAREALAQGEAS